MRPTVLEESKVTSPCLERTELSLYGHGWIGIVPGKTIILKSSREHAPFQFERRKYVFVFCECRAKSINRKIYPVDVGKKQCFRGKKTIHIGYRRADIDGRGGSSSG